MWRGMPRVPYLVGNNPSFTVQLFTSAGIAAACTIAGIGLLGFSGAVIGQEEKKQSFYDFTVLDIDEKPVSLSKYKGKVVLVVNVACKCGFTSRNYTQLQVLHQKYNSMGLEILAFPCNQFGGQEPGNASQIKQFVTSNFNIAFPLFAKIEVNGPNTHPLFQFLKSSTDQRKIRWNFEKFLIDRTGTVVGRYGHKIDPLDLEQEIVSRLQS